MPLQPDVFRDSVHDFSSRAVSVPRQHELVALGIDAHREVGWLSVFRLRFLRALTARGADRGGARDDVGNLEGESRPGPFAFSPAVDGNDPAGDLQFGDVRVPFRGRGSENIAVEVRGPLRIRRPDGVFQFLDGKHAASVAPRHGRGKFLIEGTPPC